MRIAHVLRTLDPAAGGPPMVATRLAAAQARLGHEVTLMAGDHCAAVPGEWLPQVPGPVPSVSLGMPALKSVVANSDALHLHGVWDSILFRAARAARSRGVPYVITPHGMLDPWSLAQKRWKKRFALALGYKAMLNRAAVLHLLNADERRLIAPLGLRAPMQVLANGIFLEEIDPIPSRDAFALNYPQLAGRDYIVFIGRLHQKKGLDYLADAFRLVSAQLPHAKLVVAGPDDGARTDFEQRIDNAKLTDRVIMTGPLYGARKWMALAGAACFCLPSRQEGFSIAILEALACRIPVVVSEACHFGEVVSAGAGTETPLDPQRIAEAICRYLRDPERRQSAGIAGRRLVEEQYTWPKIAERSVDLYRFRAVSADGD
jgi:glycosyltransferase involved in cell wall biosynthesis